MRRRAGGTNSEAGPVILEHIFVGGRDVQVPLVMLCPGPAPALASSRHRPHVGVFAVKHPAASSLAWVLFSKALKFMLDLALDQMS